MIYVYKKIRVLKLVSTYLLLIIPLFGWSQNPDDVIDTKNLNVKYLEHLVKIEIDDVRKGLGIQNLINDSILYIAATDHANYLNQNRLLSHYQDNKSKKYTPQLRAEFYGAKNYQVGENLVQISLRSNFQIKGESIKTYTYQEAAKAMRLLWVNSPGHYANIITSDYDITGVSIVYNENLNELRCAQKFAAINNLYIYKENKTLFPYADKIPKELLINFKPTTGSKHTKHAYGIKENKKSKFCSDTRTSVFNFNTIAVGYSNDSLYFGIRVRDLNLIKSYFKDKKDGISIETVLFKYNYSCNPSDNYIVPTRRNGKCEFDGYITPPMFKESFLNAIKQKEDDLKTNKIRLDKDEFLTINMGQFPIPAKGEKYNLNTLIYSHNRICKVIEGVTICGKKLNNDIPEISIKKNFPEVSYLPNNLNKSIRFKVVFEQNKIDFNREIVNKKIEELKNSGALIQRASLEAYASVEGTPEINENLFRKRAKVILDCFKENQVDSIDFKLITTENWALFFNQIKNTEFSYLLDLDTLEIRNFINDTNNVNRLENYLKDQRYVYVNLFLKSNLNNEIIINKAQEEYQAILQKDNEKWEKGNVKRLADIQYFLFNKVIEGELEYHQLNIPHVNQPDLQYDRLLFDYQYSTDKISKIDFYTELKRLIDLKSFDHQDLKAHFYIAAFNAKINMDYKDEQARLKFLINYLTEANYSTDTIEAFNCRLQHNYVNGYYLDAEGKYSTVKKAKIYLHDYYSKNMENYDNGFKYQVALYFILMQEIQWAMPILVELINEPNYAHQHYQLYVKCSYFLKSVDPNYANAELIIMDSVEKLTNKEWCDMFIGGCNISLPVFDNQTIKNLYCTKCREQN